MKFPRFPCRDKKPLVTAWPDVATTDEVQINAWKKEFPRCQWGILTGAKSGVFVLDVDPRNGGEETLAAWEAENGSLPLTPEVLTPGGGRHIYLRHPEGRFVLSRNNALGAGVDCKGNGGFVIAAGSRGSGSRAYEWDAARHPEDIPFAEAPAVLLERVCGSTPAPQVNLTRPDPPSLSSVERFRMLRYAEEAQRRELAALRGASPGERHDLLFRAAARLGEFVAAGVLDEKETEGNLKFAAAACGLLPEREKEVDRAILQAFDRTATKPRRLV